MAIAACLLCLLACLTGVTHASPITEFPLPTVGNAPEGIVYGPDGAYWFACYLTDTIGRISADASTRTNFSLSPSILHRPYGIIVGPDNNLWFTEAMAGLVGRMDTNGNVLGEYPLQTNSSGGVVFTIPFGITMGPDGRVWVAEGGVDAIGALSIVGNGSNAVVTVTNYTNGITVGGSPTGITTGPDGNIWFTEGSLGKVGAMTTAGTNLGEFQFATACGPGAIIAGSNALWFTEYEGNRIGQISTSVFPTNLATTNMTNEFITPTAGAPYGITMAKDGSIWFTEYLAGQLGRLIVNGTNMAAQGTNFTFVEFPIPSATSVAPFASLMTTGPDGTIWFSEYNGNQIGKVFQPPLSIMPTNNQVVISWSTNALNSALFYNTDLNTTNWVQAPVTEVLSGNVFTVTITPSVFSPGNVFFRLQ